LTRDAVRRLIRCPSRVVAWSVSRARRYCSDPPGNGATFQAFSALPPIMALRGEDTEDDLSGGDHI
jgi:hypothetical protein